MPSRSRSVLKALPGKATNVGNLHFSLYEVEKKGEVTVLDHIDTDLALLQQRFPRLRSEQIRVSLPTHDSSTRNAN